MIPGGGIILVMTRRVQIEEADGPVGGALAWSWGKRQQKSSKSDNNMLAEDSEQTKALVK